MQGGLISDQTCHFSMILRHYGVINQAQWLHSIVRQAILVTTVARIAGSPREGFGKPVDALSQRGARCCNRIG